MSRAYPARCTCLALALLTACSANFSVPEGTLVTCTSDSACPSDLPVCAVTGLCVSRDLVGANGPTLLRATPASPTTIVVEYDLQLLPESVAAIDAYRIAGLEVVAGALRSDNVSVLLETSAQVPAFTYTLETPGVRDIAGRANTAAAIDFRGFGLLPDELAPDLVTPPDNAQVASFTTTLSWSGRSAATKYFIEISRVATFSPLVQEPIEVAAPATNRQVSFPGAGTYYWRVRSNIQSATADLPFHALHLFDDTVYVACADAIPADDCTGGFGTREQPYQSLNAAVAFSGSSGIANVVVATRATPYRASLVLQRPISMVCAYDAAFTESNVSHPTTIESINASGALFVSSVNGLSVRACNFSDSFGAAAVSIVGSRDVELQRVGIASAALDDVAALSLLDSTVVVQDSIIEMFLPMSADASRGDPRSVALVRTNRSELSLIDSVVRGAVAFEPTGVDINLSRVTLEGTRIDTGGMLFSPGEFGLAVGVRVVNGGLTSYASSIRVGAGFQTVAGIRARGSSDVSVTSTRIENHGATGSSTAVDIDGEVRAELVNTVLSPGYTGNSLQALEAKLRLNAHVDVFHSLLLGSPGKAGPVIKVGLITEQQASCAPYDFAFVNNIIAAGGAGLYNIITAGSGDDNGHNGTLFLNNALVTTNSTNCIRDGDANSSNPADLGCTGQSLNNIFRSRTIQQLLGNLAGNDGILDTLDDNDYRPTDSADRIALRAGHPTTGTCAAQPCVRVTQDSSGAVRTSSPPTIGPFDFP